MPSHRSIELLKCVTGLPLLTTCLPLFAAPPPVLEVVNVIGVREAAPTATSRYEVSALELARNSARTLQEVVEAVPGVQAGARGGDDARISVRGSGLQNVVFTKASGVDLLLDGFPVGGADGNFDYSLLSPILVRGVDFQIGAGANQRGSLALGGAIDFLSPTGIDDADEIRLDVGSFGFLRGALQKGWRGEGWDAAAQMELRQADGFRDFSEGDSQKLGFNVGFQRPGGMANRTFFNAARVEQDIALPISQRELQEDPEQGRVNGPPGNFNVNALTEPFYAIDTWRIANRTTFAPSADTVWELGVYYLYRDVDFRRPSLPPTGFQLGPGWLDSRSDDLGGHLIVTSERQLWGRPNRFIAGLRFSGMWGEEELSPNLQTVKGPTVADGDLWAGNATAFFENSWSATEHWTMIVGGRAFHSERNYEDRMPGSPNGDRRQDYNGFAPKIGFENTFFENMRLFGSLAQNIQPPTFGDIVAIPIIPPPPQRLQLQDMDEQRAWVAELGASGVSERSQWQVAAYYSSLRDEIIRFAPPGAPPSGNQIGQNADRTEHLGLEAVARYLLWHDGSFDEGNRISLRGSYTLREHRFDGDSTFADNELAGVPTQLLFAELLYESSAGWFAGPNVSGIPDSFYIDNANTFKADSYLLLGLRAGWTAGRWRLFAEGRNLLDQEHAAAWQNAVNARGDDQSLFFPGEGRGFNMAVEYRW